MKLLLLCLCLAGASAGLAPLITSTNQRAVPDSWIVRVKDSDKVDEVADEILGRFSKMRLPTPEVGKLRKVLPALTLRIPARLIDDIRSVDGIEYIEQNSIETPAGSQYYPTWGLDRIDSRTGQDNYYKYNSNVQGKGVNIYVMDSGVQTNHVVFGGRAHTLYGGSDNSGHGTHCAGTAAGNTYGIAREAEIYSVQICQSAGCLLTYTLRGCEAILKHANGKGGVISRSMSGVKYTSKSHNDAMRNMWTNGFVVSHAAGNSNADTCAYSPQMIDEVIATGATDSSDKRASFSNWGSCVDLFAPGVSIRSAKWSTSSTTSTTTKSGTSMACPHTSGAAALLLSQPGATPQSVKNALIANATPNVVSDAKGSHNRLLYVNPTRWRD